MAAQIGRPASGLGEEVFAHGYRFEFFQAVRLLARLCPDREPVGRDADPSKEVVRFRSHVSLSFPPSPIQTISRNERNDGPIEMTVAFMGLTGPLGVLPSHYTELLLERMQVKDTALRDFLDLFNHRMISLFYRAWEKHHWFIGYERSLAGREHDQFADMLFALMGLGTGGLRERLSIEDRTLLRYAGLLTQRPRSAHALEQCLGDYFNVPVAVKQFIGARLRVSEQDWTRLGVAGGNNVLGRTAMAGTSVWDQQARFQVRLGPLAFPDFDRMLPAGTAYPALIGLTKLFAGQDLDFEVHLVLKRDEAPACRLGEPTTYAPRLGWTTWLKTVDRAQDAYEVFDVVFSRSQVAAV